MRKDNSLRLCVGTEAGRRSSTWRIWFGPRDVYAAFRSVAGIRKMSVHYPRPGQAGTLRYIGFTRNYEEGNRGAPVTREERTHAEWKGAEFAPNYFIEFRFRVPECELRPLDPDDAKEVLWLCAPPVGAASEVTILSGPSTHSGLPPQRDDGGKIDNILQHQLENGRYIWVQHHHIPAPPPEVIQSYRDLVARNYKNTNVIAAAEVTKNRRISLTMDCGDGSAAEAELSADFLYRPNGDA